MDAQQKHSLADGLVAYWSLNEKKELVETFGIRIDPIGGNHLLENDSDEPTPHIVPAS